MSCSLVLCSPDLCLEFILPHLTPHTLGLLACASKDMLRMADDDRVWRRQAVLAWNGFYCCHHDHLSSISRALMERFLAVRCPELTGDREHPAIKVDRWRDWDGILCALEIVGDGYKTLGWIETDPKQVVRRDLQGGGEVGFFGQKAWVEAAEEEWWDEVEALNAEMDSDFEAGSDLDRKTDASDSDSSCSD